MPTDSKILSAESARSRSPILIIWVVAVLVQNALATSVAISQRWPAAFGVTPDPDHITVSSGSAISAPAALWLVLVLCAVLVTLQSRWLRVTGAIGAVLLGVAMVVGDLGEPTMFQPAAALEEFFHILSLVFSVVLILLGSWSVRVNLRSSRP